MAAAAPACWADGGWGETVALAVQAAPQTQQATRIQWERAALSEQAPRRPAEGSQAMRDAAASGSLASTRIELSGWTADARQHGVGVAMGVTSPAAGADAATLHYRRVEPALDLGLRWRSAPASGHRIDIAAWRRLHPEPDAYTLVHTRGSAFGDSGATTYSARVETQFSRARGRGIAPELGAVGFQMNSGAKLVLRSKRGGPMVYYRSTF
ncbi:MAG: hypothetical protein GAK38_02175 [Xylophilus sp.]|nr:MAG: hypothetical protein GAK38_02175 [Xylophilus sp.]